MPYICNQQLPTYNSEKITMADFHFEVVNMRQGGGSALGFFNLNVGYKKSDGTFVPLLTSKDFALKRSKAGAMYFQPPSKPRIRQGEHQVDAQGFKQYDSIVDLYIEKGAGKEGGWGPTKEAFGFRAAIIKQAEAALEAMTKENSGRGARPAPAGVGSKVEGGDEADMFGSSDADDDLPFN